MKSEKKMIFATYDRSMIEMFNVKGKDQLVLKIELPSIARRDPGKNNRVSPHSKQLILCSLGVTCLKKLRENSD